MNREVRHYCGLFGIAGHPDAAHLTLLGMYALQHRGQESAGICVADGQQVTRIAGMGLVTDAIDQRELEKLRGPMAIGHVRYSTTGSCSESNVQPLIVRCSIGQVAICHNGNLVNAAEIRRQHEEHGHIFITTSDTEVILHMLADRDFASQPDPLAAVLRHLTGSYCLLLAYPDRIEAVRDPSGNRPLCLGRQGEAWVVASETRLDMIDAEYVRDVEPGEIITLTPHGMQSRRFVDQSQIRRGYCIFEHVYFADPPAWCSAKRTWCAEMGRPGTGSPADADLVIPVPNCARCAAMGFHEQSGIPVGRGFTTNHYVGRSFIQPTQYIRDLTVHELNPIRPWWPESAGRGRRFDRARHDHARQNGLVAQAAGNSPARRQSAHSPSCYYGIDFPSREELVAHTRTVEEIRDYLEVDSLAYLSLEGMLAAAKTGNGDFCHACFSGEYPIPIDPTFQKDIFERHQLRFELVANDKNGASLPVLQTGPPTRPRS